MTGPVKVEHVRVVNRMGFFETAVAVALGVFGGGVALLFFSAILAF